MNCSYKRAIGTTPYRIMFGRVSSFINLLQLIQFDSVEQESTPSEVELIGNDVIDMPSDYPLQFDSYNFEEKREVSRNVARESIIREHIIQKRILMQRSNIRGKFLLARFAMCGAHLASGMEIIFNIFPFPRHEIPSARIHNREADVVWLPP